MRIFGFALALVAVLAGCGDRGNDAPAAAYEKQFGDGEASIAARLERNPIGIAENAMVRLEAVVPETARVEFPRRIGREEEFRTVRLEPSPPRLLADGRVSVEQTYELEPFEPGEYTIPPFAVDYEARPGAPMASVWTESFSVEVQPLPDAPGDDADEGEIADIRGPLPMPPPWGWIAGGLLAAALAGWLAARWWKSRQPAAPAVGPAPPPTPHAIALAELDALLASDLRARGLFKEFYIRLSDILRRFVEARFGLRAPERTTEEFLGELRQTLGFDPAHRALLREFLLHCDLVKFAEQRPSAEQTERSVALCRQFVAETKSYSTTETRVPSEIASPG